MRYRMNPDRKRLLKPLLLSTCGIWGLATSALNAADTTATWQSPTSGDWSRAANWSTSPNAPDNGTPSGVDYQAAIAATGSNYTVSLDSNITVDALTINSANASMQQTSGTLQAGIVNIEAGSYTLNGGTIQSGIINQAQANLLSVEDGVLDGVTLEGGDLGLYR